MITNQKIDVGDASYSRLSHVLRFTAGANAQAIQMVEDICGRTDMSMEEIAHEMGKCLKAPFTPTIIVAVCVESMTNAA